MHVERVSMEEQATPRLLHARWLGRIAYRDAWGLQQTLAAARAGGALDEDQLLLLEHGAVLTLGRNASDGHVIAPPELIAARGIEVVRVERGGEVTYHGPGQLVAYPIVALAAPASEPVRPGPRPLGVRRFVEALESAMADTCAASGVAAGPRVGHPGCWVDADGPIPRKIGALGIRVARGVTFHGIALNVTTDLADFDLIDPCGMPGIHSTSLARERQRPGVPGTDGDAAPTTASVAEAAAIFAVALARRLGMALTGDLPPFADAAEERRVLEALVGRLGAPSPALAAAGAR
jgi:lipoyl(octanoyl) transferase